jgi:hypothetical protein
VSLSAWSWIALGVAVVPLAAMLIDVAMRRRPKAPPEPDGGGGDLRVADIARRIALALPPTLPLADGEVRQATARLTSKEEQFRRVS